MYTIIKNKRKKPKKVGEINKKIHTQKYVDFFV